MMWLSEASYHHTYPIPYRLMVLSSNRCLKFDFSDVAALWTLKQPIIGRTRDDWGVLRARRIDYVRSSYLIASSSDSDCIRFPLATQSNHFPLSSHISQSFDILLLFSFLHQAEGEKSNMAHLVVALALALPAASLGGGPGIGPSPPRAHFPVQAPTFFALTTPTPLLTNASALHANQSRIHSMLTDSNHSAVHPNITDTHHHPIHTNISAVELNDECARLPLTPSLWHDLGMNAYIDSYPGGHNWTLEVSRHTHRVPDQLFCQIVTAKHSWGSGRCMMWFWFIEIRQPSWCHGLHMRNRKSV